MNHHYQLRYLLPILAALAALATAQSLYLNPLPLQSGASSAGSDVPSTTGSVGFLSHAQAARLLAALSGASRGADPLVLASLDTTAARKEEPASSYLFAPHAPMHVVIEAVGLDDGADVTAAAPAFVLQEDDANESILAVPVAQTAAAHANAEFKPNNGESSSSSYDEIDVTSTADVDRVVALLAALAAHPEGIQEDGSNMGPRLAAIRVTGLDAARPEYKDQVASVRRILASAAAIPAATTSLVVTRPTTDPTKSMRLMSVDSSSVGGSNAADPVVDISAELFLTFGVAIGLIGFTIAGVALLMAAEGGSIGSV